MSTAGHGGKGGENVTSWSLPTEVARMRHFLGQRLGVVDLTDEQRYHSFKQRFHNLRLHGAGVLCGLTAGVQGGPTVLAVGPGAAIDAWGREVVVSRGQCIDVAAWFAKYKGG